MRFVLWVVNLGARTATHGSLSGITSIHFANWCLLDGGRRLLFLSNFDGSWESYLDDFIDKVAWGLNGAFSNGVGYPRTRWLVLDGAKDEPAFKRYLRANQLETQLWYSAYPGLTAVTIASNAALRRGLHGRLSSVRADRWARLL